MYFLKGWDMATHSFTCKQAIPACLYSPAAEHHRHLAGTQLTVPRKVIVDLGDWLHTEIKWRPRESNPDTVTHPSTNRTRRRLTSLIKTKALPLRQTATSMCYTRWFMTDPDYNCWVLIYWFCVAFFFHLYVCIAAVSSAINDGEC